MDDIVLVLASPADCHDSPDSLPWVGTDPPGSGDDLSKAWETFDRLGAEDRAQEAENFARQRWARIIETGQTMVAVVRRSGSWESGT